MTTRWAGPEHGFVSSPTQKDYAAENKRLRAELAAERTAREQTEERLRIEQVARNEQEKEAKAHEIQAETARDRVRQLLKHHAEKMCPTHLRMPPSILCPHCTEQRLAELSAKEK